MALPTEMLYKIVSYLPYEELANMMLVSTLWKGITEDPIVWKKFILSINEDKIGNIVDILDITRFARLENIKTVGRSCLSASCLSSLFTVICKKETIKSLDLSNTDVCDVAPNILSETINAMTEVNLDMNMFTFLQADSIFMLMRDKTKLEKLSVKYNTLSMVDSHLLADCLTKLRELNLTNTYLTSHQVTALFLAMARHTTLTKLTMVEIIMADVPPELFAKCLHKLKYLKLTNQNSFCMTQDQLLALINQSHQSHLRQLCLECVDLSFIPCQILACFINSLENIIITKSSMTVEQMESVFEIMEKDSKLKKLHLHLSNHENYSMNDIKLRAEAVSLKMSHIKFDFEFE